MVQVDGVAPYAPVKAVLSVIERHRQVGVPMITVDTLQRMGVTESLSPRTAQALRLLGLTNDDGSPSDDFEALRKAPTDQVGPLLAALIRDVYAPVFEVVDPTTSTVQQIEDAFRGFKPPGQRGRMVTLFTGLMAYAGMVDEAPKQKPGPAPKKKPVILPPVVKPVVQKPGTPASLVQQPNGRISTDGDTYTVELASGGAVSVVVDVNLFDLTTDDRTFVIDLVDKLKGYPQAAQQPAPKEANSS